MNYLFFKRKKILKCFQCVFSCLFFIFITHMYTFIWIEEPFSSCNLYEKLIFMHNWSLIICNFFFFLKDGNIVFSPFDRSVTVKRNVLKLVFFYKWGLKFHYVDLEGDWLSFSLRNDNKQEDTLNGQLLSYINCNL